MISRKVSHKYPNQALFVFWKRRRIRRLYEGFLGGFRRVRGVSSNNKLAFCWLQRRHAITVLSQVDKPPLDLGITWSMVNSRSWKWLQQYWHWWLSLRSKFLRVHGNVKNFWSIYWYKAMTEGTLNFWVADLIHLSVYSTAHAFPTYVKRNASCQVITSMGWKDESSFKTPIFSI